MNFLDRQFGRLGNRMFQSAFLYAYARDHGIDWYYQDPKWFEKYAEDIKAMFGGIVAPDDRVSIHVRRGDYINNTFYTDLFEDGYYQRAMAQFSDRFLVFSDDIEWCKEQNIFQNCDFFHGDEEEDLNAMLACKHNIIANSSFSWWAAYLNPNPNKIVMAPKNWHPDGIERTVCPKEWIRL